MKEIRAPALEMGMEATSSRPRGWGQAIVLAPITGQQMTIKK